MGWLTTAWEDAKRGLSKAADTALFDPLQKVSDAASGARYLVAPTEDEQAGDLAQGSLKAGFHEAVKQSPVLKGLKKAAGTVGGVMEGAGYLLGSPTDLQRIGLAEQGNNRGAAGAYPLEKLQARNDPRGLAPASIPSKKLGSPTFADILAHEYNSRPVQKDAQQLADEAANRGDTASRLYHSYWGGVGKPVAETLASLAGASDQGIEPPEMGGASKAISLLGVAGDSRDVRKAIARGMNARGEDVLNNLEYMGDLDADARAAWTRAKRLYPRLTAHHLPVGQPAPSHAGGFTADELAGQFTGNFHPVEKFAGGRGYRSGEIYLKPGLGEEEAFKTIVHELTHGARSLRKHNQGGVYRTLPPPGAGEAVGLRPDLRPSHNWGQKYDLTMDDLTRKFIREGHSPADAERLAYEAHPEEIAARKTERSALERELLRNMSKDERKAIARDNLARRASVQRAQALRAADEASFEDSLTGLERALASAGLQVR